jgi:Mn-dependent DtxR family transcriptional regulator
MMVVQQIMDRSERDYLRVVYELAERKAKSGVAFDEVQDELGYSEAQADGACEFWVTRGVLEWLGRGHVALTHIGLRRAERLAARKWSFAPF